MILAATISSRAILANNNIFYLKKMFLKSLKIIIFFSIFILECPLFLNGNGHSSEVFYFIMVCVLWLPLSIDDLKSNSVNRLFLYLSSLLSCSVFLVIWFIEPISPNYMSFSCYIFLFNRMDNENRNEQTSYWTSRLFFNLFSKRFLPVYLIGPNMGYTFFIVGYNSFCCLMSEALFRLYHFCSLGGV